jgi:hypothetical protein
MRGRLYVLIKQGATLLLKHINQAPAPTTLREEETFSPLCSRLQFHRVWVGAIERSLFPIAPATGPSEAICCAPICNHTPERSPGERCYPFQNCKAFKAIQHFDQMMPRRNIWPLFIIWDLMYHAELFVNLYGCVITLVFVSTSVGRWVVRKNTRSLPPPNYDAQLDT